MKIVMLTGLVLIVDVAGILAYAATLPDDVRVQTTKNLALQIRQLPVVPNKLSLAEWLAGQPQRRELARIVRMIVTQGDTARRYAGRRQQRLCFPEGIGGRVDHHEALVLAREAA